ncbi:hydrogenase 2 large subunit [Desulfolithobacter dissulfuricans]|uniref:Hydrogenase 2 large subunit n=1 Tax=Desulfolithobacter dissulfuricans TaxID=2795293 RepID=A0A915XKM2_9BACT|nr:nickel-dependent hydrogenase large subunit [Desulfolithobacter dissulfuricans]BCO09433.1 hydrogenase 2 large subunit [Desulfolithobacter dissulfuricans]
MAQRIVVDPVTRIEGHLRIDAEVDGGVIKKAWSSGQMWRGIEVILQGRDPRDAWLFTQRICGVCTTVHALASVRSVENALGMEIPINAQYIRNLVQSIHALHDHIVHFYVLSALDWVDVVSALSADVRKTVQLAESLSNWPGNSYNRFKAVKEKVQAIVDSGQLGPFANAYWGHSAMTLPPEANLMAVSHYLEALDYQRKADQALAIISGKNPHIQNLSVGGVTAAINPDNEATLNMERLYWVKQLVEEVRGFIQNVYLPDVIAVGALYKDWLQYGAGVTNYLAVPDMVLDTKGTKFDLPGGTIMGGDLKSVKSFTSFNDPYFRDNVVECIARSWYDGDWTKHPYEEETVPKYTEFQDNGKYTWLKAPRFQGEPMQVGPLAQVLVGYAQGHELTTKYVDDALSRVSSLAGAKVDASVLHSTPGRHLARAVRAAMLADLALKHWQLLVDNIGRGDLEIFNKPTFPKGEQQGFGFHEAPRGALSHWIVIRDGKIKNYQCVVPSTWNAGPRDDKGKPGPYEASLVGNPMADPEMPLEVLRTVHSFDPCIACAVHMLDPEGREFCKVKAL